MADEIGPVVQYLLDPIDEAAGRVEHVQTWRLRVEEVWTDGLLAGVANRWLDAHLGVRVVSIQYRTAIGPSQAVSSALIIYREEVGGERAAQPARDAEDALREAPREGDLE